MRLRQTIHAPKRLGEEEEAETFERVPILPPRAHPYDPTLPEAAFPTLEWPRPLANNVNAMEVTPTQPMELDEATFDAELQTETQGFSETVPQQEDFRGTWIAPQEPGNFERDEFDDVNDVPPITGLKAYEIVLEWHMIPDGMKLIMLSEMTQSYGIVKAVDNLGLRDKDIDYLARLQERERLREKEEQEFIARNNAQHLQALLTNPNQADQSAATALWASNFERETQGPSWFINSEKDITRAYQYLRLHGEPQIAQRMWDYHGVDTQFLALDLSLSVDNLRRRDVSTQKELELPKQSLDLVLRPEQQETLQIDNEAADPTFQESTGRTKRKYTKRSGATQSGQKRSSTKKNGTKPPPKASRLSGSTGSGILTLRAPSGLRNVVSAEDIKPETESPKQSHEDSPLLSSPTVDAVARRGRGRPKKAVVVTEQSR